jgi:hypothetical protein
MSITKLASKLPRYSSCHARSIKAHTAHGTTNDTTHNTLCTARVP